MSFSFFVHIVGLLFSAFVAGILVGVLFSHALREKVIAFLRLKHLPYLRLTKALRNPLLTPNNTSWMSKAVSNPAALVLEGHTHLVFRALGTDAISRLGYARSTDGITFDARSPYPMYTAQKSHHVPGQHRLHSESPRMVCIDGRVYLTTTIADESTSSIALLSMSVDDFTSGRFWKWDGPHFLSKPGEHHTDWTLFPEKIGGKYAVLHRITPTVEVAYRDTLEAVGTTEPYVTSWVDTPDALPTRNRGWDTNVHSVGPPPLRTNEGWLVLYHAMDDNDPGRYKLGALLLDLADPTRVLYRSGDPVLVPTEGYENHKHPGVIRACGATIQDGTLFVYYGGGDTTVCAATAPLTAFLRALIAGSQPTLYTLESR